MKIFNKKALLALAVGAVSLASCAKWTEVEVKNPTPLVGSNKSDDYYAKLRAYKETDHQMAFGWFSGWTGTGSSLQGSLAGLPDSVDFISLWGGWKNPSPEKLEDLRYVQKVKGTRALVCFLLLEIGGQITPDLPKEKEAEYKANDIKDPYKTWRHEFWGWSTENTPEGKAKRIAAAEKYANALCDTIDKYGYDGFDLDAEPGYNHPFDTEYELWAVPGTVLDPRKAIYEEDYEPAYAFVRAMGKRIGPKAETEAGRKKLFVVDGEPEAFKGEMCTYFNYFISQAYKDDKVPASWRLSNMVEAFAGVLTPEEVANRWIITSNFEDFASIGGYGKGQILSFAAYNPSYQGRTYRKAGVGAYRMDLEYAVIPPDEVAGFNMKNVQGATYPWLRKAIQIMNPVIK